jgi:hypothetical protein
MVFAKKRITDLVTPAIRLPPEVASGMGQTLRRPAAMMLGHTRCRTEAPTLVTGFFVM